MSGIRNRLSALLGEEVSKNWYNVPVRQVFLFCNVCSAGLLNQCRTGERDRVPAIAWASE